MTLRGGDGPVTKPAISVILPSYNHATYLPRRIESILNQTLRDFELLILDDCSPDDSRDVILRYSDDQRVRTLFNDSNSGNPFRQWSKGLSNTTGEYIWIAESDDFAEPNFLERLARKLDEDPEVGFAFCESVKVDGNERHFEPYFDDWDTQAWSIYDLEMLRREFSMDGREYARELMLPWNTIPNASAVLFRREALESVGGPDTSMRLCGDWLTYLKILSGSKVAHVPDRLNYFRDHPVNVRSKTGAITFVHEYMAVVHWGEQTFGAMPAERRRRMRGFVVQALLGAERRPPANRIPFSRIPRILKCAFDIDRSIVTPTVRTLIRELGGRLLHTLR